MRFDAFFYCVNLVAWRKECDMGRYNWNINEVIDDKVTRRCVIHVHVATTVTIDIMLLLRDE